MPGKDMRRDFASRDELIDYLKAEFPQAVTHGDHVAPLRGGLSQAQAQLERHDPGKHYEKTRNYLSGGVSRLSAYIRYGVLTLAQVRDHALEQVNKPYEAEKFVNELAWRDYWQRVYRELGDGIWDDQEPYKTGYTADEYADELPQDIRDGQTGMVCVDEMSRKLRETGYLHNHERMWLAAYIVHWRRVRWQAGARWFLTHLLDGDPASNNLSWQWVASTFSHKPYYFNRENIEKFSEGVYCEQCPLYRRCAFEGSYEAIERRLFPDKAPENDNNRARSDKRSHRSDRSRGGRR